MAFGAFFFFKKKQERFTLLQRACDFPCLAVGLALNETADGAGIRPACQRWAPVDVAVSDQGAWALGCKLPKRCQPESKRASEPAFASRCKCGHLYTF